MHNLYLSVSRGERRIVALLAPLLLSLVLACARPPLADPARAASAPATVQAQENREPSLPLDPMVRMGRLANGLTYYLRVHQKPEKRAALRLAVNAGSILEEESERGLAHFVEHMAFNGTKTFAKQAIVDVLEKAGVQFGRHTNAYTSFDETVYMLEVPTDDGALFARAIHILREFASEVAFEPEEVEKERGVVIEEWRLGLGAQQRVFDQQLPVLFRGSRYAERLPIGKKEVLTTASADALRAFYKKWYRPDLMAVIVVGDIDVDATLGLIEHHFNGWSVAPGAPVRPLFPVPDHAETLAAIVTDKELTQTSVAIANKLEKRPTRTASDYRRHVAESLYHHMVNARLAELAQSANPPFFYASSSTQPFVRTRDVFYQVAIVKQDGAADGLLALARELERIDRHGFLASELERARAELARHMQNMVIEKDKIPSSGYAAELLRHFLNEEFVPGIELEKTLLDGFLPEIGLDELNRLARAWLGTQNRVLLLAGPETARLPERDAAVAALSAIGQETLAPYEDRVRSGPLVTHLPTPGVLRVERQIPELGAREWTLSNGIRVILKPTDFKNDQILITGFSPGGHSLVSDADFPSAEHASAVLGRSGAGDFGPIELDKALAGKLVSAYSSISELEESAGAEAAPADLETAFALLYLYITAPRIDPDAIRAWRAERAEQLAHRARSPELVFRDAYQVALYGNHPRRQPPNLERLDRFDPQKARAIHAARFADLSDATFVIVGNFTWDRIQPLVLTYLGGLPGADRKGRRGERWRDVGARVRRGPHRIVVERGVEPRATVYMTFSRPAKWTSKAELELGAMVDALNIRLREVIREDLGGSYGVGVHGQLVYRPRHESFVRIGFSCAPEAVEKLMAAVNDEIARLFRVGFPEDVLTKVRESRLREHEVALKTNEFWLSALAEAYRQGRDPRTVLDYPARVRALDGKTLTDALGHYVASQKPVVGLLLPERGN